MTRALNYAALRNLNAEWQRKLSVLETFNGRSFFHLPWEGASFGDAANAHHNERIVCGELNVRLGKVRLATLALRCQRASNGAG